MKQLKKLVTTKGQLGRWVVGIFLLTITLSMIILTIMIKRWYKKVIMVKDQLMDNDNFEEVERINQKLLSTFADAMIEVEASGVFNFLDKAPYFEIIVVDHNEEIEVGIERVQDRKSFPLN